MIENVKGDLLLHPCDIKCHQVNCRGSMGAGIALQIKRKYPEVMPEYTKLCKEHGKDMLGKVLYVVCKDGTIIANLFGQDGYSPRSLQTDYAALEKCIAKVSRDAELREKSVGFPRLIGCALAGGDWKIVNGFIEKYFKDSPVPCYIVDFN